MNFPWRLSPRPHSQGMAAHRVVAVSLWMGGTMCQGVPEAAPRAADTCVLPGRLLSLALRRL